MCVVSIDCWVTLKQKVTVGVAKRITEMKSSFSYILLLRRPMREREDFKTTAQVNEGRTWHYHWEWRMQKIEMEKAIEAAGNPYLFSHDSLWSSCASAPENTNTRPRLPETVNLSFWCIKPQNWVRLKNPGSQVVSNLKSTQNLAIPDQGSCLCRSQSLVN